MALLTKEQILQATDVDIEEVEVPEWGGVVRVCGLDAQYVQRLIERGFIQPGTEQVDLSKLDFIDMAARAIVDENGAPMLTRNEAKALGRRNWAAIALIAKKSLELSGFGEVDDDEEQPKNE